MIHNVKGLFKRFLQSKDGNFGIMVAVIISMIVLVVAVAVDSSRLVQASTKLKALNDMAAFAATEGQNKSLSERKKVYELFMESGLANSPELKGYEYDLAYETNGLSAVLTASSRSEAQLFFPVTRGDAKFVSAHSEITVGREHVEVSLVLDISTSMDGSKIIELQNSARDFIQTLMSNQAIQGRVSIAIVPYGGSVRLPSDLSYMLTPSADTSHWIGGQWNGCLSTSPIDYSAGLTPQLRLEIIPDFFSWQNNWCPDAGNELVGLSKNETALLNKIDNFTLSDGTATDIGVAWGLATLDPLWRHQIQGVNGNTPRNFNERTKKFMIVMTDGGITGQRLPRTNELVGALPYHTQNETNTRDDANNGYQGICDLTKSKGIEVYTIGFQLNTPQKVSRLQYCGTSAAHNYEADLGQLSSVFQNIAISISGLRLSQ